MVLNEESKYIAIKGDFNKIGNKKSEKVTEQFGLGERNEQEQLIEFTKENNLYVMNPFFMKN